MTKWPEQIFQGELNWASFLYHRHTLKMSTLSCSLSTHACFNTKWKWSHSVVSDSLQPHGHQAPPSKSTGVGCLFLLQGNSRPRDWTQVSHIVDRCFTVWATREVWIQSTSLYLLSSVLFGLNSFMNQRQTILWIYAFHQIVNHIHTSSKSTSTLQSPSNV